MFTTFQEYDLDSECSEEGQGGRTIRRSFSLEIYGLQREQHVYFSNQEYYRRLEELKSAHLRNMAELERMYITQGREGHTEEDDGDLGRGQNRAARLSVRLDMSYDPLINRERGIHAPSARCLDFHINLLFNVCVVLKDLSLDRIEPASETHPSNHCFSDFPERCPIGMKVKIRLNLVINN